MLLFLRKCQLAPDWTAVWSTEAHSFSLHGIQAGKRGATLERKAKGHPVAWGNQTQAHLLGRHLLQILQQGAGARGVTATEPGLQPRRQHLPLFCKGLLDDLQELFSPVEARVGKVLKLEQGPGAWTAASGQDRTGAAQAGEGTHEALCPGKACGWK